jgi:predicted dehydrogenase
MAELRWGVLSTADIARTKVIPAIRKASNCRIVAIASRDEARARQAAAELDIPRWHDSYEALLADTEVDAVYIPLPNHLHPEWTMAAARAGKHVLCEKPLATNAADAERMIRVCEDSGVRLMEAFMYRLHPSWTALREVVSSGRLGELMAIQSWFSYFNDDASNIRNMVEAGGGALFDIGCYQVNLSRMLMAEEPERVQASIRRDPAVGVDILTSAILDFKGGRMATFTCSIRTEDDQRVHVYGSRGHASIWIPFNIPPDMPTKVFGTAGGQPPVAPLVETLTFETADPYTLEFEHFAAAVLDGSPVPYPPEDAVANLRVMERIFAAAETPERRADQPPAVLVK